MGFRERIGMIDVPPEIPDAGSKRLTLKIYGERNSGTNYLKELLQRNADIDMLPGTVPRSDLRTLITRQIRAALPETTDRLHERARDRYFAATFVHNLGWKHMCPAPERMNADALRRVRFLMVVKNPYAWLLSLYARPYHVGGRDARFEDFLERRLPVMEARENIGSVPLPAVEVWNRKVRGYLALDAAATYSMIVRYEDFLADEMGMVGRVSARLGLQLNKRFVGVTRGVKHTDRNMMQTDYATYYLEEHWRDKLTAEAVARINRLLDPDMVARMGYAMIDPDAAAAS